MVFKCHICGKYFVRRWNLDRHLGCLHPQKGGPTAEDEEKKTKKKNIQLDQIPLILRKKTRAMKPMMMMMMLNLKNKITIVG